MKKMILCLLVLISMNTFAAGIEITLEGERYRHTELVLNVSLEKSIRPSYFNVLKTNRKSDGLTMCFEINDQILLSFVSHTIRKNIEQDPYREHEVIVSFKNVDFCN